MRHWLEMPRIHASGISAEMIEFQAFGNLTSERFIDDSMAILRTTIYLKVAIAMGRLGSRPFPALALHQVSLRLKNSTVTS